MTEGLSARNALRPGGSSAERVRRHRERRRRGEISISFDIRRAEIEALVARGFLARGSQGDRIEVACALGRLLDRVLAGARR